MRTTLELDDELVAAAKQLAQEQGSTLGEVISDLARKALVSKVVPKKRNGVLLFTPRPGSPSADLHRVNALRDEE